ncbi:MAG TPA: hypothetical protein VM433_10160 [Mycobacteriales bacterium]|nr:hypothetical protein [Mycobacteriales bacterium]
MGEGELLRRFAALHRAVADRDALERRLRVDPDDARLRELSLAACEQVLAHRSGLYRCLLRQGWTPPAPVVRHLLEDEALLAEPLGSAGG